MEGMKFDGEKAAWDLVPMEIINEMSVKILFFIKLNLVKGDKIVFNDLYNIARSSVANNEMMNALIACCILADRKNYSIDQLNSYYPCRWDLINPVWTTNIAEIFAYGARKYERDNWKKVELGRYYAALNRHLDAYASGENYDSESGFKHLYHAAWNCIALIWFRNNAPIPEVIVKASKGLGKISLTARAK
jgi:hypothetical protein